MFIIDEMSEELMSELNWQSTPLPMYKEDFNKIVVQAIKKLYVDCNHPENYHFDLYIIDAEERLCYDYDFNLLEEEYIYILSKIKFYQKKSVS